MKQIGRPIGNARVRQEPRFGYDCGATIHAGSDMRTTMASVNSIGLACLCVGIAGCATQLPTAYRMSNENKDQPEARACLVNGQRCQSMMAEAPRPCLTGMENCAISGTVRPLDIARNWTAPSATLNPNTDPNRPK